jgi:hypothetical protein
MWWKEEKNPEDEDQFERMWWKEEKNPEEEDQFERMWWKEEKNPEDERRPLEGYVCWLSQRMLPAKGWVVIAHHSIPPTASPSSLDLTRIVKWVPKKGIKKVSRRLHRLLRVCKKGDQQVLLQQVWKQWWQWQLKRTRYMKTTMEGYERALKYESIWKYEGLWKDKRVLKYKRVLKDERQNTK